MWSNFARLLPNGMVKTVILVCNTAILFNETEFFCLSYDVDIHLLFNELCSPSFDSQSNGMVPYDNDLIIITNQAVIFYLDSNLIPVMQHV